MDAEAGPEEPEAQKPLPRPSLAEKLSGDPDVALSDVPFGDYVYRDPNATRFEELRKGVLSDTRRQHYEAVADVAATVEPEAMEATRDELQQVRYNQHQEYWVPTSNPDVPGGGDFVAPTIILLKALFDWATE